MKALLALALAVALAAPAAGSDFETAPQFYRLPGAAEQWRIVGAIDVLWEAIEPQEFTTENMQQWFTLYIDDEEAAKGRIYGAGPFHEFGGTYKGHAVNVICATEAATANTMTTQCLVLIDNERAARLDF